MQLEDETLEEMLRTSGRPITASQMMRNNPFALPKPVETFGYSSEVKEAARSRRREIHDLTLVERTDAMEPRLPPCYIPNSRSATAFSQTRLRARVEENKQQKKERRQRIGDFIQQKRDIYMAQMLLNRKNQELRDIYKTMQVEDNNAVQREADLRDTALRYKMENGEREARLTRQRKACDIAAGNKVAVTKEWKRATISVAHIRSDIARNLEMLDAYRTYRDFMNALLPEGKTTEEFYTSPKVVLNEMAETARVCYNILERCQYLSDRLDRSIESLTSRVGATETVIDDIEQKYQHLVAQDVDETEFTFRSHKTVDKLDNELIRVTTLVKSLYRRCFGRSSDISALGMLEHLETQMETYFSTAAKIDPAFIAEQEAIKIRLRREEQRRLKQEKQEQDAARKREQAMERAAKPVKKHEGRPLVPRQMPIKHEKNDEEKLRALRREQERMEKILFGDPYEWA